MKPRRSEPSGGGISKDRWAIITGALLILFSFAAATIGGLLILAGFFGFPFDWF